MQRKAHKVKRFDRRHTVSALSGLRRELKPLLARVLAGEPWNLALRDPSAVPAEVAAACVVSYVTRREPRWHRVPGQELALLVSALIAADRAELRPGEWPFLDALECLLPSIDWSAMDALLSEYRAAWPEAVDGLGAHPM